MTNPGRRATIIGIIFNTFLFIIKFLGGLLTGSLAMFSDALNSFSDTVYSVAVFIAVKISHKKADEGHPFGHHRAEPIAALLISILAGILGFEIIKEGLMGLIATRFHIFNLFGIAILLVSMGVKAGMWLYLGRIAARIGSPALHASSVDSRNDILISSVALLGFSGPALGFTNLDCYAAILIGLFVIRSGYRIGAENIDYLMGKSPNKELLDEIYRKVTGINGVLGIHELRAHYVGNYIHVQVHVEVDKTCNMEDAHEIGKKVETLVKEIPFVDDVFIHIDPK